MNAKTTNPSSMDYFSWDNLRELAGLDAHITFLGDLLQKYEWTHSQKKQLETRFAAIREKQMDERLNISVIGDFSSGKSTFINALLRTDLLEAGVLQGTTVASTVLEDGSELRITLDCRDGRRLARTFASFEEMRTRLNQLVAQNSAAQYFTQVVVQMPTPSLARNGLRIIDTPGLNATIHWHEQATIRTLQEVSDLSVILVDALRPLPENMVHFIQTHLQSILDQCVFVVTKMDLIRPKERTVLLQYIQKAVRSHLGVKNPLVLPYASLEVLSAGNSGCDGAENPLLALSLESETNLLHHVAQQRAIIQTKKLIFLTGQFYDIISQQLTHQKDTYTLQLSRLEQARLADLASFVQEQTLLRQRNFIDRCLVMRGEIIQNAQRQSDRAQKAIHDRLSEPDTTDALNRYVQQNLKADCRKEASSLCSSICRCNQVAQIKNAFVDEISAFQKEFQQAFRFLPALQSAPSVPLAIPLISTPEVKEINLASVYTQKAVGKENLLLGSGAATGAAVGTAFLPLVGTIVGGFLGALAGSAAASAAGADIQKMRKNVLSTLDVPLRRYFSDIADHAIQTLDRQIHLMETQIARELNRYLETYQSTVQNWIRQEEDKKQQLEHQIATIQSDLQQLDIKRQRLASIQTHLQALEDKSS